MFNLFFRRLSKSDKQKIALAIHEAELKTSGEIRVHVSYSKSEKTLLALTEKKFYELKMHETSHRNAMLLYLNPRIKKFAIFGDQGIHEKVGQNFWDDLRTSVSKAIQEKNLCHGIIHAVEKMGIALKNHYPHLQDTHSELSDEVSESD